MPQWANPPERAEGKTGISMITPTRIPTNRLMVALIQALGLVNLLVAEKIPVNGGFGWDGVVYGRWAKDFYNQVFLSEVTQYELQRVLPAALVHFSLRLIGAPLEDRNIILGFGVLNLFLLVIAVSVWGRIADALELSDKGKWLGFVGLVLNFAILKMTFYHPVLTDTSAFALGMLLLYFFLKDNSPGLWIVSLLGAFTWPTIMYFGLVLLVFPRKRDKAPDVPPALKILPALAAALITVAGIIYFHFIKNLRPSVLESKAMPIESVVPLSVAGVALYLFFAVKPLADFGGLYDIGYIIRSLRFRNLVLAITVYLATQLVVITLSSEEPGPTRLFFVTTLLESVTKPLIFMVAHPIYYGPLLILTFLLWKPICRHIHQYGIGLIIVMIVGVVLSINPESRRHIPLLPFFVAFTVKDAEALRWNATRSWLLVGLSLFFSKIWLPINRRPLEGNPLDFPWQRYFMNHGPWMSNQMYLIQGGIVLLTTLMFYFLLLRKLTPHDTASDRSS